MQKGKLGKSGLEVSKIGFGSIPINRIDADRAAKVIIRAFELGIDWIDTAEGSMDSEAKIGIALQQIKRKNIRIFTKSVKKNPEDLKAAIEQSLERMGIDYIDVFQFHNPSDPDEWAKMLQNGCLELLKNLQQEGIVKYIGASAHKKDMALQLIDQPEIEVIQFPFNFVMVDHSIKVLEKACSKEVGFIAMKPFGGGLLYDPVACIKFQMKYPHLVTDPGFEKEQEVEQVVEIVEKDEPLTLQDQNRIEKISNEMGRWFCRRCGYCQPCPQGVPISQLLIIESLAKRISANKVVETFRDVVKEIENCTKCGKCAKRCPYELPVPEKMRKGVDIYDKLAASCEA